MHFFGPLRLVLLIHTDPIVLSCPVNPSCLAKELARRNKLELKLEVAKSKQTKSIWNRSWQQTKRKTNGSILRARNQFCQGTAVWLLVHAPAMQGSSEWLVKGCAHINSFGSAALSRELRPCRSHRNAFLITSIWSTRTLTITQQPIFWKNMLSHGWSCTCQSRSLLITYLNAMAAFSWKGNQQCPSHWDICEPRA
jgi:hypothetical protein